MAASLDQPPGPAIAFVLCSYGSFLLRDIRVSRGYNPSVNKDRLTKARRSWNMSRIRAKDTIPKRR